MLTLLIAYKKVLINLVPNSYGLRTMVFLLLLFLGKVKNNHTELKQDSNISSVAPDLFDHLHGGRPGVGQVQPHQLGQDEEVVELVPWLHLQ